MTQQEFDKLPLLLKFSQVMDVLDGVGRHNVYALRRDGSVRTFCPIPDDGQHRSYYFKSDVARVHGRLVMNTDFIYRLPVWLRSTQFLTVTGLCRRAFDTAVRNEHLVFIRHRNGWGKLYREDLKWFL